MPTKELGGALPFSVQCFKLETHFELLHAKLKSLRKDFFVGVHGAQSEKSTIVKTILEVVYLVGSTERSGG